MKRKYAQGTTVPISNSREQINDMLRRWGCLGIGWIDNFDEGNVELQFKWPREHKGEVRVYAARVTMPIEKAEQIKERCQGSRGLRQAVYETELSRRGRAEHRLLLLWVKASLEAVDGGLIEPEQVFLPWLVRNDGRTVYEAVAAQFQLIATAAPRALLAGPSADT